MTEAQTEAPARRRGRPPMDRAPEREASRAAGRSASRGGRTRTGRIRINDDMFHVPPDQIPDGMTYQWNRESIMGQPDPQSMNQMTINGWTPVPAERHPELAGHLKPGEGIRIGGQLLMERPAEMTEEARQEEYNEAISKVQQNFKRLQLDDASMLPKTTRRGDSLVKIKKEQPVRVVEGDGIEYERE